MRRPDRPPDLERAVSLPRLRAVATRDVVLSVLVVSALAFFAYLYVIDGTRPGMLTPEGWFGYHDQSQYFGMARELSTFSLSTGQFQYGLGYPLVAVPMIWLGLDYDPFLVFNAAAFVFVIGAAYVVARRLFGPLAAIFAGFGLLLASPLPGFVVTPWNSTVSLVALCAILLVATTRRPQPWHGALVGGMVGWAFATRYVDLVWLAIIGAAALWQQPARDRVRAMVLGATVCLAFVIPVLGVHSAVLGSPFDTPYAQHISLDGTESDQDLTSYRVEKIPRSAFGVFVSPFLLDEQIGTPLLAAMFWSLGAPGGIILLLRRRRWRPLAIACAGSSIAATAFYLSFRGMGAGTLQFGTLHYIKMWWPLIAILAGGALAWLVQRAGPQGEDPQEVPFRPR